MCGIATSRGARLVAHLLAIFAVDQELEAEMRKLPYRPFQPRPKASEWRWLEYSEPVPEIQKLASRLYSAIKKTVPIDQGTVATFAALADRGLVNVDWREYNVHGQRTPYIRLTPAGRRLARSWTGQKAYNRRRRAGCASGTGERWRRPTRRVMKASRASTARRARRPLEHNHEGPRSRQCRHGDGLRPGD